MSNYITENRTLIAAIKQACKKYSIQYTTFSDDWIIKLQRNGQTHFVFGYSFDCNNQASSAIALDKVATYQLLTHGHIAAVPHYLLKSIADTSIHTRLLDSLLHAHKSLVIKPLQGSRGQEVEKFEDAASAQQFMRTMSSTAWAASPYIDIQREIRFIIFDNKVRLTYEKTEPKILNNLKMYNLNLGAHGQRVAIGDISTNIATLALDAMHAIGLHLGAVDVIFDIQGEASVLEINGAFSLEHYALLSPENRREVMGLYDGVVGKMFAI